jgi:hypothetical protein
MRAALQALAALAISCSIALAAIPAQTPVPQTKKASCCAMMKAEAANDDCSQHAPKSDQDKQCCAGCVFCLAILSSSSAPFVYPPTGEESFALFTGRELDRPHRPLVPPPRLTIA